MSRSLRLSLSFVPTVLLGLAEARSQTLTVTSTAPTYQGFNISCFGGKNGSIDVTVSGGVPPYTYAWSNGATTQNLTGQPAGYYELTVTDAAATKKTIYRTLTEPEALKGSSVPFKYPNGQNISCYNCYNGSIDISVAGGVPPYSYNWGDGVMTQDRSGLGATNYGVKVLDANGCEWKSESIYLTQPEKDTWTMTGNTGTNPLTQFIGTTDNKDVVFKSNGQEVLRLKPNGGLKLFGGLAGAGPLYRDSDGTLRLGGPGGYELDPVPPSLCALGLTGTYWRIGGNSFAPLCSSVSVEDATPKIGTTQDFPLHFITNNSARMVITKDGKVGIGTEPPDGEVDEYRLFVEDGVVTRDVLVRLGEWPDYVFADGYALMSLEELRAYLNEHQHLPGIPSAAELNTKGGVAVGDMQRDLVRTVEEQALYILQLESKFRALEQRLLVLETSQH